MAAARPQQPPPSAPPVSVGVASAALQAHLSGMLRLDSGGKTGGRSLAVRLGLLPGPPPQLTPADWLQVHLASQRRGDSRGDCPICLRAFRDQAQVLLSCSHTFHAACLSALERFAAQRGAAACPLCRAAAYEKRRIDDAERLWRHTCAARIQAAWRGWRAWRDYRALRRLLPPAHPALRRRWAAEALGESAAPLVQGVEQGAAEINALFAELDASAAAASAVYRQLGERCAVAADGGPAADDGATAAAAAAAAAAAEHTPPSVQRRVAAADSRQAGDAAGAPAAAAQQQQQQPDWEAVLARCLERDGQPECAVCLAPLGQLCGGAPRRCSGGGGAGRGGRGGQRRQAAAAGGAIAVLSCTHAFHSDCLSAVEAFAVASELAPCCPCCRAAYSRLDLC